MRGGARGGEEEMERREREEERRRRGARGGERGGLPMSDCGKARVISIITFPFNRNNTSYNSNNHRREYERNTMVEYYEKSNIHIQGQ